MSQDQRFSMIDVGEKSITRRRAVACGEIHMKLETLARVRERQLPKGDVIPLAEAAGILAAKKTSELLPLCHPLLLDSVTISTEFLNVDSNCGAIRAQCEVICHGKTGAEMEALMGVNAALLCIYDLVKGVDPALSLHKIYLDRKEGGKSGIWNHPQFSKEKKPTSTEVGYEGVRVALLIVSDRCSKGEAADLTGPFLAQYFSDRGAIIIDQKVVPDEKVEIQNFMKKSAFEMQADLIVTSGGTGLSPRDVTPEAILPLFERKIDGFGEALRKKGALKKSMAWLSRAEAGMIQNTLTFILPGSVSAVNDAVEIFDELLPHAIHIKKGGAH